MIVFILLTSVWLIGALIMYELQCESYYTRIDMGEIIWWPVVLIKWLMRSFFEVLTNK